MAECLGIYLENRAYITTDPEDSDIDVAFYDKKNMEPIWYIQSAVCK